MHTVGVIGSGNWGSTIARLLAKNIESQKDFDKTVYMWTYEEIINGEKLTEIINKTGENVKYLKGVKLGNVLAVPDLIKVTQMSDILVFVTPHQFIKRIVSDMQGKVRKHAIAVNLSKGLLYENEFVTVSDYIKRELGIPCAVLMGANISNDVACDNIAEGTLGYKDERTGRIIHKIFNCYNYRVTPVKDVYGVEVSGALKNIVSIAYGITQGLNLSCNTSVAILRVGFTEMVNFIQKFFKGNPMTLLESSGIADLIVSCLNGRNFKCGVEIAKGKTIDQIESEMNGQKLQGTLTSKEVYEFLRRNDCDNEFPLFVNVYRICYENELCDSITDCIPHNFKSINE